MALLDKHRPSRCRSSGAWRNCLPIARDPVSRRIHLIYRGHATRARPSLSSSDSLACASASRDIQRMTVCRVAIPYQLPRAFRNIGAKLLLDDESSARLRSRHLTRKLRISCASPEAVFPLAWPWCAVEMSVDWMRAIAEPVGSFPHFVEEPYFADYFSQQVEERHADEALGSPSWSP